MYDVATSGESSSSSSGKRRGSTCTSKISRTSPSKRKNATNFGDQTLIYKITKTSAGWRIIAEEVAEVMPDLVHFSEQTGQPDNIRYQFLPPLMLNELQKQHKQIEAERQENAALRERIDRLERIVEGLKARQ